MADGFLGRWAQRKQAVREGKPVVEPLSSAPAVPAEVTRTVVPETPAVPVVEAPPPPTLQDAQALTPESDFQRFVAPDVDPEVKHAAMRKLFADPHFNVMDGLDIYIDDYSQPDPLPESMLRKMASAQFLGLVEEEKEPAPDASGPHTSDPAAELPAPQTALAPAIETDETTHHDDPDLRLQQDHAPGPQGSGRGA